MSAATKTAHNYTVQFGVEYPELTLLEKRWMKESIPCLPVSTEIAHRNDQCSSELMKYDDVYDVGH
jgi:hypothetical protein